MLRVRWWLLAIWGAVTALVWSVRAVNVWRDLLPSTEERVAVTAVAASFVVLGLVVIVLSLGMRRYLPTRGDHIIVGALAGWTVAVWAMRLVALAAGGDHSTGFVAVHASVAAVSVSLAAVCWREVARLPLPERPPAGAADAEAVPDAALDTVAGTDAGADDRAAADARAGASDRAGTSDGGGAPPPGSVVQVDGQ